MEFLKSRRLQLNKERTIIKGFFREIYEVFQNSFFLE